MLDLNERLFIIAIEKLCKKNLGTLCSLKELYKDMGLPEEFYIKSIIGLEKKKAIEIGFLSRNRILKVVNWQDQYFERNDFFLKTTKKGLTHL